MRIKTKGGATGAFNPVYALAIFIFAFILYSNSINNCFVRDDSAQILNNPWIKSFSHAGRVFLSNVWAFTGRPSNYYRPLMYFGYMIVYSLFGLDARGYHLLSVLLHSINSVLVYAAACLVIRRYNDGGPVPSSGPMGTGFPGAGPIAAGLVFAAQPVHVEAVAWAGGYPDLLAAMFSLAAFLVFAAYSGRGYLKYFALEMVLLLGAFFSKEPAVTIPFVFVAYDLLLSGRGRGFVARYAPLFCALAIYMGMRTYAIFYGPAGWLTANFRAEVAGHLGIAGINYHPEIGPVTAFLTGVSFFARYLFKMLVPIRLNPAYGYQPVSSVNAAFVIPVLAAALFAFLLYVSFRRDRRYFFAGLFFLLPLAPSLYISHGLGQFLFAERYLYLPSIGFALAAGLVLDGVCNGGSGVLKKVVPGLFAVLLVFYTASSFERNHVWKDDFSVWSDAALKTPDNGFVQYNYGVELEHKGLLDGAIAAFRKAVALQPDYMKAYSELGGTLMKKGENEAAVQVFQTALSINDASPDTPGIHYRLARAYLALGNPDAAIGEYRAVLAVMPNAGIARELAGLLYRTGSPSAAEDMFKKAQMMDPAHAGPTGCGDFK